MAEQEVIEWQPGLNRKLELSGASSSLVVFVTWSDEEETFKNAQVDEETNVFLKTQDDDESVSFVESLPDLVEDKDLKTHSSKSLKTQDDDESASFVESLPDLVEDKDLKTHSSKSVDVTEEQMIEEGSTNNGMIKANAKDILDEWQTEAKGIVTGGQKAIAARTSSNSELKSSNAVSPFAIPESWYGEDYEETSCISSSHDSTEASPIALEDIAKGKTMNRAFKFTSDDKGEENREKLMSLDGPDEVISEGRTSSTSLTTEFEPVTVDEKDEELLNARFEPIAKNEKDEEVRISDVSVEVTGQRNVATLLSDSGQKDIKEESNEKHIAQNGSIEGINEARSEMMTSTSVSNNQDKSDKVVLVDNDQSVVIADVSEIEIPGRATDALENVEMKPSVAVKEKKWGRERWSKLWGAFVKGRIID